MVQLLSAQAQSAETVAQWVTICPVSVIAPNTGINTLVGAEQAAIFRVGRTDEVYALSNFDPFSKAFVLSRGLVGDRQGGQKLISPIYKQNYDLKTGECLDDATVSIPVYSVRVVQGQVQAASSKLT